MLTVHVPISLKRILLTSEGSIKDINKISDRSFISYCGIHQSKTNDQKSNKCRSVLGSIHWLLIKWNLKLILRKGSGLRSLNDWRSQTYATRKKFFYGKIKK